MQHHIPDGFEAYLKKLIGQKFPSINLSDLSKYLNDIYGFYLTQHKKSQQIPFIKRLTKDSNNQNELINLFISQGQRMRLTFNKTESIFGEVINNFEEQLVANDKFTIFLSHQWLNNKYLEKMLFQKTDLIIDHSEQFFYHLSKIISLDWKEYEQKIIELLSNSSSFDNFAEQAQNQIIKMLYKRKQKQQQVVKLFQSYDVSDTQKIFPNFYKEQSSIRELNKKVEPFQEFSTRVKAILIRYCPSIIKWKTDIINSEIALLYSQVNNLDIKVVKQSLVSKRFFKRIQQIPSKLLKQIFNIEQQKLFSSCQQSKLQQSQQLRPSNGQKRIRINSFRVNQGKPPLSSRYTLKKQISYDNNKTQQVIQRGKSRISRINSLKKVDQHQLNQQKAKDQKFQIEKIMKQIKTIRTLTKKKACPQILLRQIQINIIQQRIKQTYQNIEKLKKLLTKYKLDCQVNELFDKITNLALKKQDKIPKITEVRRRIQCINLQEIIQTKKQIQLNKQCEDASAIMIIGETGVGKSTILVGLSGYEIILDPQTNDFQASNLEIRQKYRISKSTMSVTRWANVSCIHHKWTNRSKILLIDTPGLQQNRGIQIDITNNLGTVKLIKTLKKGRIIIVISQKNFGNRWFSGFKRLIKGISKYLTDIKSLRHSITFVLTKGLKLQLLLDEFNQFERSQGFQNENWSDNQFQLIRLIRENLQKLPRQQQIYNPSKHSFKDLSYSLLDLRQIQYPGQFICASFSTEAQIALDKAFIYVKSMILRTFQLGQFDLAKYYLNNLSILESIEPKKQQYKNVLEKLKIGLKQKTSSFQTLLKQYINWGLTNSLNQAKKIKTDLQSENAILLYEIIYQHKNSQKSNLRGKQNTFPNEIIKQVIENIYYSLNQCIEKLQLKQLEQKQLQEIHLQRQAKKKVINQMNILKQLISENQYLQFVNKINHHARKIYQRIIQILKKQQIDKNEWQKIMKIYLNKFQTDLQSIEKQQSQKYQPIKQIIKIQYLQNSVDKKAILEFLQQSHYVNLNGKLYQRCKKYLNNLQIFQNTHYIIKSLVDPQSNQIAEKLMQQMNFCTLEQQKCSKSFDSSSLHLFQIYQSNKQQFYKIIQCVKNGKNYLFNTQKRQQSLYKQIEKNLQTNIKNLEKDLQQLLQNPVSKKFQQIRESAKQIFWFLKIIKTKIQSNYQNNATMTNIKRIQNGCLEKTLINSQKIILEIQNKIRQRSQRNKITNFQPNQRLQIYYFIADLFQQYEAKHASQQQRIKKLQTKRIIKEKLISPIKQILNLRFTTFNDYQKLLKAINYFKQLDDKFFDLGIVLVEEKNILPINSSQIIQNVLKQSYENLIKDYNFEFLDLVKLLQSKHSIDIFDNLILQEQEIFRQKQMQLHKSIRIPKKSQSVIKKQSSLKFAQSQVYQKEKKLSTVKVTLQQYLNSQKIKKAINYILSYEQVKKIILQFNEILPTMESENILQKNIDLKKNLIQIVQKISHTVQQVKNPTSKNILTRQNLYSNYKQINFLNKILLIVKRPQDKLDFEKIIADLKQMIDKQQDNFQDLFINTQKNYKSLKFGVEFDDLRKLIEHKFAKDKINQKRIAELLFSIEYQYSNKIIKSYHPELNKNTQVLLNMSQFKSIVQNSGYNIKINYYQTDLFTKNSYRYFEQLYQKYDQYLKKVSRGLLDYQKQLSQISTEEHKIIQFLPNQYKSWKQKNRPDQDNISDQILQRTKQKQKQVQSKYMSKQNQSYKIDSQFKQIYLNTNTESKEKMKEVYIYKFRQRVKIMQQYLLSDHQKLYTQIKNTQNQFELIPTQIKQEVYDQLQTVKEQINKIIIKRNNNVQKSIDQKNLQGVLDQLNYAVTINNIELMNSTGDALARYYSAQKKDIDMKNLPNLQKRFQLYKRVYSKQQYKLIKQNIQDLVYQHQRFLQKIKDEINQSNKQLLTNLKGQKQKIQELNPLQKFKISNFISIKNSVSDELVKSLLIQKKFKGFFLFSLQYEDIVENLSNYIDNYKQEFQNQILLLKNSYLQPLRQGPCSKSISAHLKADFPQTIRSLIISKQMCINFIKLQNCNFTTPIDLKTPIEQCTKLLKQLEQILLIKKVQLQSWNFEENLHNDTKQRLIQNFTKITVQAQILNKFIPIITSQEFLEEQIEISFLLNNEIKFTNFETQIMGIINQSFIDPTNTCGQKVRIYYDFIGVLKENKIKLFKQKNDLGTNIKNLIDKKFHQTQFLIESFSDNSKYKQQYNKLINKLQQLTYLQHHKKQQLYTHKNMEISMQQRKLQKDLQRKINQFKNQNNDSIIINRSITLSKKTTQKELQLVRNKIQSQYQYKQNHILKEFSVKKNQIIKQMAQFLQQNLIKYLIIFQHTKTYYSCEQKISKSKVSLSDLLAKIKKKYTGSFIQKLYVCLLDNQSKFCSDILQLSIFQAYKANPFIELTKGQNFQTLISSMPFIANNNMLSRSLQNYNKEFQKFYQQKIDGHQLSLDREAYLSDLVSQAQKLADQVKKKHINYNKQKAVRLLACIFSLWTAIQAIVDQQSNQVKYHYKPHPGQVLALFLLLGLDQNAVGPIPKKIIQIQTGQGKSIVLGALSAFLALIGYDVYEACYSQYLSERDYESFRIFFEKLGVAKNIKYDIFPEVCKSILDWDKNESFRQKVQSYLSNSKQQNNSINLFTKFLNLFRQSNNKNDNNQKKKVLLIDEADVFLDQNYLGQTYRPSIRYYSKNIQKLLYYVWGKRDMILTLTPQQIYQSEQFKQVVNEYNLPQFQRLMKNQIHGMMKDLAIYKNDIYTLIDGVIYYKEGDGLSDKIRYGYRTLFSYLHEYEINKQINLSDLTPHIAIYLAAASFSYSRLPNYFESIIGVTGTLQSMSGKQKQIMRHKFNLDIQTLPSIYPRSRRTIQFRQCTNSQLYRQIVKSIQVQYAKKRPILVFFNTKQETYNFFDSHQFNKFKSAKTSIVTYEVEKQNRDFRINQSTDSGNITILTMDFSRGTDFKIRANKKEDYQGLHVISASLPNSYSDYIQLIGRTGRQGRNGSALIFTTSDQAIEVKQISQQKGQRIIKQNQEKYWIIKAMQIQNKMKKANEQHEKSLQIFKDQSTSIKKILQNIYQLNQEPLFSFHKSNTVICIDGTSSMKPVFEKVKQVVNGAMPDIYKAIKESKVDDVQIMIKIVIYRNYNSTHNKILQSSSFQNKQQPLVNWLKNINFSGGWGNQAVEVCLQYINSLKQVNQVIIIADAVANTQEDIIYKRKQCSRGQAYWNSYAFPQTYYEKELQQLVNKKIKIHSYYIGQRPKQFFDYISQQTNGQSRKFLIDRPNATSQFAQFVAQKVIDDLQKIVGSDARRKILDNYHKFASYRNYV